MKPAGSALIASLSTIMIFTPLQPNAATYCVDNGNSQASDANAGTAVLPWKTIQKGANTAVAGDSVIVKTGTYAERITFSAGHAGSAGKRVVFFAQPRRTVYMQGFNTDGADWLRIEGFDITNSQGGWLNGGIWLSSSHVEVVDNYLHDIPGTAIQASWSGGMWDSVYIASNRIYCVNEGIVASGNDWLVENNEVERLKYPDAGDCDYSRFFGNRITFRGNYFHGALPSEIGSSHTDGFQTFDDNGEKANNITIENNVVVSFHEGMMLGMNNVGDAVNYTIRNNIFHGGDLGGAWGLCVVNITNLRAVNNAFCNMIYHGIGFNGSNGTGGSTGMVKNNIFYNSGSNYWADSVSTVQGGYNIIYDTAGGLNAGDYDPKDLVNVNPKFVNPRPLVRDDFKLQASSPAINAGTALAGLVDSDMVGTPRPQGAGWDIGPFEYFPAAIWNKPASRNGAGEPMPFVKPLLTRDAVLALRSKFPQMKVFGLNGNALRDGAVRCDGMYLVILTKGEQCWKVRVVR
ncbi:MAG TPA: choice-of-anchor Q domain-containing protein [Chitinivibrionales bacterium]|nr:choice-of-anchor Q domain-containing protein [Chitinivibrionales bacterium]